MAGIEMYARLTTATMDAQARKIFTHYDCINGCGRVNKVWKEEEDGILVL
jgi:hypothetical protein